MRLRHALLTGRLARLHDPHPLLGGRLQMFDDGLDLLGGGLGAAGQVAHLVGHHREAAPRLAGACRLDGGVEGQQVGLLGDLANHLRHHADLLAAFG